MRIIKEDTTRGKTIKVRGQRLGMTSEPSNPIIEIIQRNEKNVGFLRLVRGSLQWSTKSHHHCEPRKQTH
jgi:hypothetical protein